MSKIRSFSARPIPAELAVVLSKSVAPRIKYSKIRRRDGSLELPQLQQNQAEISKNRAIKTLENTIAIKLLPDIARALNIRISSILSPSGVMENEVRLTCEEQSLDSTLKAALIQIVQNYIDKDYKINSKTRNMLMRILGTDGSYATLILPESAIDHIINGPGLYTREAYMTAIAKADQALYETDKENNIKLPKSKGILKNPISGKTDSNFSSEGKSFSKYNPIVKFDKEENVTYQCEAKLKQFGKDTEVNRIVSDIKVNLIKKLSTDNSVGKIAIIDNPDVLKSSKIIQAKAEVSSVNYLTDNNTAENKHNDALMVSRSIFGRSKKSSAQMLYSIPPAHALRSTYGAPLIRTIPTGAILNIIQPSMPDEPIGHMVMLDVDGYPIDGLKAINTFVDNTTRNKQLTELVGQQYIGMAQSRNSTVMDFARTMYEEIIERELVERVRTGLGIDALQLTKHSGFYDVMLSRQLAGQFTQILYVPKDYISYMAFDYDEDGNGKSLLDGQTTINSMRVVMMHNDVLAGIKNSVGVTTVDVNVDENDPDPESALELVQENMIRSQIFDFGNALLNSSDTIYQLQRMGFVWNINGHPGLPDTKATYVRQTGSAPKSDEQLTEYLRKASHYNIGVPPEMVDNSEGAEFATQSIIQNTLFGKQALQDQQIFCGMLSGLIRRLVAFNGDINNALYSTILENIESRITEVLSSTESKKDEQVIDKDKTKTVDINKPNGLSDISIEQSKVIYKWILKELTGEDVTSVDEKEINTNSINEKLLELARKYYVDFVVGMKAELPKPPSVTLESQIQDYGNYKQFCTEVLEQILSDDTMPEGFMQGAEMNLNYIRASVLSRLSLDYITEKGILPELVKAISLDENRSPDQNKLDASTALVEYCVKVYLYAKDKIGTIGKTANVIDQKNADRTDIGDEMTVTSESLDTIDVLLRSGNPSMPNKNNGPKKPGPRML